MKASSIGLIAAIVVLATSIVAVALFAIPLDVQHIEADITIEDRTAFKLTNDSMLHFGSIDRDNTAERSVVIENIRERPITAVIYIDGPRWLSVNENRVRLDPGEERTIVFTADPPDEVAYGPYAWNISIVYRRV